MNNRIIYYFSGTGNSLYVAKNLARALNCPLSPMSKDQDQAESDVVGLVFPVYYAGSHSGIPNIVKSFVSKHQGFAGKYVFAVCTSGYSAGDTLENLSKHIKKSGGKLAAGYVINMSAKSLGTELREKVIMPSQQAPANPAPIQPYQMSSELRTLLDQVAATVRDQRTIKLPYRSLLKKIVSTPLRLLMKPVFLSRHRTLAQRKDLPFNELTYYVDNSFITSEACTGCGICAQVCPVNNIVLIDNIPKWQNHCETCLACYQWCPENAIGGDVTKFNTRYHHPAISLKDMLRK